MLVQENTKLTSDIFSLDLTGEFPYTKAKAGQFVNILVGSGQAHPLRRPISIASCNPEQGTLTLVYRVVGHGTQWLSERLQGDVLDVLGPLGQGFPVAQSPSNVLVVGGGVGIPPLYQLAKELAGNNFQVDIVLGFRNKDDAFWIREFTELGEVTICTEDGSLGEKGYVTTVLKTHKNWTTLYSCGPKPMLKALKSHFRGQNIAGYVSLEERMACGVGACWGCTCRSGDGFDTKRICKDGPVFPWEEVAL